MLSTLLTTEQQTGAREPFLNASFRAHCAPLHLHRATTFSWRRCSTALRSWTAPSC